ncbi:hypothetical protein WCE14_09165 [Acinetobacter schindleri]|uniref:hypothetical protein n=1 Tax=Acinetobacter schindleri TaxID=108981 RepID=UPI0034D62BEA
MPSEGPKESHVSDFINLCAKYQIDPSYTNLAHTNGVFDADRVQFTFTLYRLLMSVIEGSPISRAYNSWRTFNYGDSRRIHILFDYADRLQCEDVETIWLNKWDLKDRNIDLGHEITCRIFILSGIAALENLNKSGVLQ